MILKLILFLIRVELNVIIDDVFSIGTGVERARIAGPVH